MKDRLLERFGMKGRLLERLGMKPIMTRVAARRLLAMALAVACAACARMIPPTGGPEDRTAPQVVAYVPDSAALNVSRSAPLRIVFNEPMNRTTVRDWLLIAPWPGKMECMWRADTMSCEPLEGWADSTTYAVLLATGASDRRNNALAAPVQFAFSTGSELADCRLEGHVRTRSLRAEGVPLYLFSWPAEAQCPLPAESSLRPDPRSALRIAQSTADGAFVIPFVPRNRPFLLGAMHDRNSDRAFDEGADLWGFAETPIVCADTGAVMGAIDVYLVYADEPGDVSGSITDSACIGYVPPQHFRAAADSLGRILSGELDISGFAPAAADSDTLSQLTAAEQESLNVAIEHLGVRASRAEAESLRCGAPIWVAAYPESAADSAAAEVLTAGSFEIPDLAPGYYMLSAFRDLNGNGALDTGEPAGTFPYPVGLLPGRKASGTDWSIAAPESVAGDSVKVAPQSGAIER